MYVLFCVGKKNIHRLMIIIESTIAVKARTVSSTIFIS